MKKIFFILLIIVAVGSFCFIKVPLVKASETKTFVGTIESFSPVMGRPPKWYFSRFTAVADNGERKEFWILGLSGASATSVTDFDGKPMDKPGYNHKPQVGKKVGINYQTAENGRNDAISVHYVPADYIQQTVSSLQQVSPIAPAKPSLAPMAQSGNIVIGRIDKVLPIPPGFRTNHNCALHVVPDNDEKYMSFELKNANITYFDGKPLAVQDLKKGERVEVKYSSISRTSLDGVKEAMANSVRYVPADYVPQPTVQTAAAQAIPSTAATASEVSGKAAKDNILVGKVVKGGVTFSVRCPYRFVIATDNGETKDIWIPRDGLRITDISGESVYGAPPRAGKKMEVKYLIGDNGQYEAVLMRYVPLDYVQQPAPAVEQSAPVQAAPEAVTPSGNTCIGKIDRKLPLDSVIKVVPDDGTIYMYFNLKDAVITNEDGTAISYKDLSKGNRLVVKYSKITGVGASGAKTANAISVHQIPSDFVVESQTSAPSVITSASSTQTIQGTAPRQGNIFIGKVEQVTPTFFHGLGPLTQPRSKILVTADNGEQMLFFVPGTCPVADASGKAMGDNNYHGSLLIKKGQRVEVKYSTITNGNSITNGQKGADSIRIID